MTRFAGGIVLLLSFGLSGCINNCFIFAEFCGLTGASLVVKTTDPKQTFGDISAALVEAGYQMHNVDLEPARKMHLAQNVERAATFTPKSNQHYKFPYHVRLDSMPNSRTLLVSVIQIPSPHNLGSLTPRTCAALNKLLDLSKGSGSGNVFLDVSVRENVFKLCTKSLRQQLQALPTTNELMR